MRSPLQSRVRPRRRCLKLVGLAALVGAAVAFLVLAESQLAPLELGLARRRSRTTSSVGVAHESRGAQLEEEAAARVDRVRRRTARERLLAGRRGGRGVRADGRLVGDGSDLLARLSLAGDHGVAESVAAAADAERAALPNAALIVLSHDRAEYLRTTLAAVLALEDVSRVRVYVSLDAPPHFLRMEAVVEEVREKAQREVTIWRHPPRERPPRPGGQRPRALELIADHFYAVLERALCSEHQAHSHAILIEDDLLPAPDFLTLFRAAAPLLALDSSLWCVSAWNDNGMARARPPVAELARTDFFPGLGWMISASEWRGTLRQPWAAASAAGSGPMSTGWDYWLRFSGLIDGRGCVFPLTARTRHIGRRGTNVNAKEAAFLESFALSAQAAAPADAYAGARFYAAGLRGVLGLRKDEYNAFLAGLVAGDVGVGEAAPPNSASSGAIGRHGAGLAAAGDESRHPPLVPAAEVARGGWVPPAPVVLVPFSIEDYRSLSAKLPLWPAHARCAHAGLVRTGFANATILLVDRRAGAQWLPSAERIVLRADARTVAARQAGISCDKACAAEGLVCSEAQQQFANTCAQLKAHFKCEHGCGHQVGDEIPCYVTDPARDTAGVCLHSDIVSKCSAAFASTTRLCMCVPAARV